MDRPGHVLLIQERNSGVLGWRGQALNPVTALGEEPVRGLAQSSRLDAQLLGEPLSSGVVHGRLGSDQLEVSEGDGVKNHSDPAFHSQRLRQPIQNLRTHFGIQRVLIERHEGHAPIPNPVELGLDAAHRAPPIPMDYADVESVLGELVSARESEPTRAPENQCPFIR